MSQESSVLNQAASDTDIALIGRVLSVSATALAMSTPNGNTGDLALTEQTQIANQVPGAPADITVGAPVMVVGLAIGPTLQAVEIQLGGDETFIPPGQSGPAGAPGAKLVINGQPKGGAPLPPAPVFLAGVVAQIDGRNLSVRTRDGSVTSLTLSERPVVQKFVPAPAGLLRAGSIVRAWRAASSNQLTRVYVINPPGRSR